jgi:hypothetical protein
MRREENKKFDEIDLESCNFTSIQIDKQVRKFLRDSRQERESVNTTMRRLFGLEREFEK